MKKFSNLPFLILALTVLYFFQPVLLQNKLPIPADTIVGLYHPFRDIYAKDFPNGIPYKNALITDPVRQQYPWRYLAIDDSKQGFLPLWNPYSMAGMPLLGTLQSAALYPLNIFLLLLPFSMGWSLLIMVQPFLAGLFLYLYLRHLSLNRFASLLGGLSFAFCGFSTAWMEWGTIGHVALWFPVLLLSLDKLFMAKRKRFLWSLAFLFALVAAFLAGHLQTFFYISLIVSIYFFARWFQFGKSIKMLLLFIALIVCFILITAIQWIPLVQLILHSARDIDQQNWQQTEGWFVPWQHIVQFIVPDFFGNPTTLNYWGTWNYGELVGYVGIAPLVVSLFALWYRRDKKTLFFGSLFFVSLIFSLPTIFAQLPYILHVPFLATSQPTRLFFLTDFSLAVLAALGLDWYVKNKDKQKIFVSVVFIGLLFGVLWIFVFAGYKALPSVAIENIAIAKRNLIFPTIFFVSIVGVFIALQFIKNKRIQIGLLSVLIAITIFDLTRFAQKFETFSDKQYLYPQTKTVSLMQNDRSQFRVMTTDSRILPPNFSVMYRLQTVDVYDPLYLRRYGELIAASERGNPDIRSPFGFNRIVTPHTYDSRIMDLLGVKYVLSLSDISNKRFTKVMQEGETRLYRKNDVVPRSFFVEKVTIAKDKQQAINFLFAKETNVRTMAVAEGFDITLPKISVGTTHIRTYQHNEVVIETNNKEVGFLVLTDTFYPTWKASICNERAEDCQKAKIYQTDYAFRGVIVPKGKHTVVFYNTLL